MKKQKLNCIKLTDKDTGKVAIEFHEETFKPYRNWKKLMNEEIKRTIWLTKKTQGRTLVRSKSRC